VWKVRRRGKSLRRRVGKCKRGGKCIKVGKCKGGGELKEEVDEILKKLEILREGGMGRTYGEEE
jgi:hypothetical protein